MRSTKKPKLVFSSTDLERLVTISKNPTTSHREVKRASIIMQYKDDQSISGIARNLNTNRPPDEDQKATTISYDEKPAIQAIKNIAPQLPPVAGQYQTLKRDHEYKRIGTVSLQAGIDLHSGNVIPLDRDMHRSIEFIEFLTEIDKEYPEDWKGVTKESMRLMKNRLVKDSLFDIFCLSKYLSLT